MVHDLFQYGDRQIYLVSCLLPRTAFLNLTDINTHAYIATYRLNQPRGW